MYKCINCVWEGKEAIGPLSVCPVCGDNTKLIGVKEDKPKPKAKKQYNKFDINKDGKVDGKDVSTLIKKIKDKVTKRKKGKRR